jgi:hypothetical protein
MTTPKVSNEKGTRRASWMDGLAARLKRSPRGKQSEAQEHGDDDEAVMSGGRAGMHQQETVRDRFLGRTLSKVDIPDSSLRLGNALDTHEPVPPLPANVDLAARERGMEEPASQRSSKVEEISPTATTQTPEERPPDRASLLAEEQKRYSLTNAASAPRHQRVVSMILPDDDLGIDIGDNNPDVSPIEADSDQQNAFTSTTTATDPALNKELGFEKEIGDASSTEVDEAPSPTVSPVRNPNIAIAPSSSNNTNNGVRAHQVTKTNVETVATDPKETRVPSHGVSPIDVIGQERDEEHGVGGGAPTRAALTPVVDGTGGGENLKKELRIEDDNLPLNSSLSYNIPPSIGHAPANPPMTTGVQGQANSQLKLDPPVITPRDNNSQQINGTAGQPDERISLDFESAREMATREKVERDFAEAREVVPPDPTQSSAGLPQTSTDLRNPDLTPKPNSGQWISSAENSQLSKGNSSSPPVRSPDPIQFVPNPNGPGYLILQQSGPTPMINSQNFGGSNTRGDPGRTHMGPTSSPPPSQQYQHVQGIPGPVQSPSNSVVSRMASPPAQVPPPSQIPEPAVSTAPTEISAVETETSAVGSLHAAVPQEAQRAYYMAPGGQPVVQAGVSPERVKAYSPPNPDFERPMSFVPLPRDPSGTLTEHINVYRPGQMQDNRPQPSESQIRRSSRPISGVYNVSSPVAPAQSPPVQGQPRPAPPVVYQVQPQQQIRMPQTQMPPGQLNGGRTQSLQGNPMAMRPGPDPRYQSGQFRPQPGTPPTQQAPPQKTSRFAGLLGRKKDQPQPQPQPQAFIPQGARMDPRMSMPPQVTRNESYASNASNDQNDRQNKRQSFLPPVAGSPHLSIGSGSVMTQDSTQGQAGGSPTRQQYLQNPDANVGTIPPPRDAALHQPETKSKSNKLQRASTAAGVTQEPAKKKRFSAIGNLFSRSSAPGRPSRRVPFPQGQPGQPGQQQYQATRPVPPPGFPPRMDSMGVTPPGGGHFLQQQPGQHGRQGSGSEQHQERPYTLSIPAAGDQESDREVIANEIWYAAERRWHQGPGGTMMSTYGGTMMPGQGTMMPLAVHPQRMMPGQQQQPNQQQRRSPGQPMTPQQGGQIIMHPGNQQAIVYLYPSQVPGQAPQGVIYAPLPGQMHHLQPGQPMPQIMMNPQQGRPQQFVQGPMPNSSQQQQGPGGMMPSRQSSLPQGQLAVQQQMRAQQADASQTIPQGHNGPAPPIASPVGQQQRPQPVSQQPSTSSVQTITEQASPAQEIKQQQQPQPQPQQAQPQQAQRQQSLQQRQLPGSQTRPEQLVQQAASSTRFYAQQQFQQQPSQHPAPAQESPTRKIPQPQVAEFVNENAPPKPAFVQGLQRKQVPSQALPAQQSVPSQAAAGPLQQTEYSNAQVPRVVINEPSQPATSEAATKIPSGEVSPLAPSDHSVPSQKSPSPQANHNEQKTPESNVEPATETPPLSKSTTPVYDPPDDVQIPPLPQQQIPILQPKPKHPANSGLRMGPTANRSANVPPTATSSRQQPPAVSSVQNPVAVPTQQMTTSPASQRAVVSPPAQQTSVSPASQPATVSPPSLQSSPGSQEQSTTDKRAAQGQRTSSYQSANIQPTIPEESLQNDGEPDSKSSYHPPPLITRPLSSEQPVSRPPIQRKSSAPASTINFHPQNMSTISEASTPSSIESAPAASAMPPPPPPKIPLPGLVTYNLPGQPKATIFSPSQVPLPESALPSSPSPAQIPLPESAKGTGAPARAESLLKLAVEQQQLQQRQNAGKENRPPSTSSTSSRAHLHRMSDSVRSVDGRALSQLEPIELPVPNGDEDEEPVMNATSGPADMWDPWAAGEFRWEGD